MTLKTFKGWIFGLEGLNAFATGFYFNWLFFFTQKQLGFGVAQNLSLVALHGLIYTGAAWFGGWFGHRYGGYAALKTGWSIMSLILVLGAFLQNTIGQVATVAVWTFGMCFTWPIFQTLLSRGEPASHRPRIAGIYNIVWSGVAALSFFIGGTILELLGLRSMFWLPAVLHVLQLLIVTWVERQRIEEPLAQENGELHSEISSVSKQKLFLRLALLANPFAYVAINTVIPMMPEVAKRFELSTKWTGIFCSVWFFVRMAAFVIFWLWTKWHYRFGWLVFAMAGMVLSFVTLLRTNEMWMLLTAQVVFGLSVGLIYYSSLFYSIDSGAAKSEHGGMHEAMIGFGTLLGAGVGAGAKFFWPEVAGIATWAVGGLLAVGFISLLFVRARNGQPRNA